MTPSLFVRAPSIETVESTLMLLYQHRLKLRFTISWNLKVYLAVL